MSVDSTISLFGSLKRTRKVFVCVEGLCKVPFVDGNIILLGSNIELKIFLCCHQSLPRLRLGYIVG